jgi:hypothetical protein
VANYPDDISCCPIGQRCESCGADGPALRVAARNVLDRVLCLTLCARCDDDGRLPNIQLSTAIKLVQQHTEHLTRARDRGPRATHPLGVRMDC